MSGPSLRFLGAPARSPAAGWFSFARHETPFCHPALGAVALGSTLAPPWRCRVPRWLLKSLDDWIGRL